MRKRILLALSAFAAAAVDASSALAANATGSTADAHVSVVTLPLRIAALGRGHTLRLHLPADYAHSDRRYPVIYLHDAQNLFDQRTGYAGEWGVDESMDVIQRDTGFAAIVVGIDHGGERRLNELAAWPNAEFGHADAENYFADLRYVIKPWIDANYRTLPSREHTAIGGSSFGGIASHFALLRFPHLFSRALVFSPSYWVSEQAFMQAQNAPLPRDSRVYLQMGGAEGEDSIERVTRMREVFAQRLPPSQVELRVIEGAEHNEAAWRAEFPRAVSWLFDLADAQ